jgi:Flp pilus assembly protein TadB
MNAKRKTAPPGAELPYNPDREMGRMFAVGCGVLLLVFFVGWMLIAYFWLH